MAKKLQKTNKGMNPKAKFTLSHAFKGIISNQAVIDGSKDSPWWVAAIFFVFAVIIPLIPGFVKIQNTNGGAFASSVNYGFDTALTAYAYHMNEEKEDLKVEKGILHYYDLETGTEVANGFEMPDDDYIADADDTWRYVDSATGQITLRVFLWDGLSSNKLSKYVNRVAKQKFVRDSDQLPDESTPSNAKYYIPNLMFITPRTLAVALYKSNSTSQVATSLGGLDWKCFSTKVGLFEFLNRAGIKDEKMDLPRVDYVNQYRTKVMKQMLKVFNNTYLNQKNKTLWSNTGIYAAIYAGIILFLGLMIFILTRGKANPFKVLNIWECQKIAWWASFTPAVLGLILAFVFSGNMIGQMAFILLISLRVMWLSMKQLRPVYQQ